MPRHYPISIALHAWWLFSCHVPFPPRAITLRLLPCLFRCKTVCVFACFVLITLNTYSHVLPDVQDSPPSDESRAVVSTTSLRLQQRAGKRFPALSVSAKYRCLQVIYRQAMLDLNQRPLLVREKKGVAGCCRGLRIPHN